MESSSRQTNGDQDLKCSAVCCTNNSRTNSLVTYFRFPSEGSRCKTWLINCGRQDLNEIFKYQPLYPHQNAWLCADHFDSKQFICPKQRSTLKPKAVPTVFSIDHRYVVLESIDDSEQSAFIDDNSVNNDVEDEFEKIETLKSFNNASYHRSPNNHQSPATNDNNQRRPVGRPRMRSPKSPNKLSVILDALPATRRSQLHVALLEVVSVLAESSADDFNDHVHVLRQLSNVWGRGEVVDLRCNEPQQSVTARLSAIDLQKLVNTSHSQPVYIRLEFNKSGDQLQQRETQPATDVNKHAISRPKFETHRPSAFPRRKPGEQVVPFPCAVCGRSFQFFSQLEQHQKHHNGVRPFACSTCGQRFALSISRDKHETMHSNVKPLMCDTCGRCFSHINYLKSHQQTHDTARRPYICQECDKRFLSANSLRQHTYLHFSVVGCVVGCGNEPTAVGSEAVSHQQRGYSCHMCGMTFTTIGHVRWHLRRVHSSQDATQQLSNNSADVIARPAVHKYSCNICKDSHSTTDELRDHIISSHSFECPICPTRFLYTAELELHLRDHTSSTAFTCGTCGTRLANETSLAEHTNQLCGFATSTVDGMDDPAATVEAVAMTMCGDDVGVAMESVVMDSWH